MGSRLTRVLGSILLIVPFLIGPVITQTSSSATISGIVTNQSTKEPMPKALVTLRDGKDGFGTTLTDSKGRYAFPDLPAGDYRVQATRNGFLPLSYGAKEPNRPGSF